MLEISHLVAETEAELRYQYELLAATRNPAEAESELAQTVTAAAKRLPPRERIEFFERLSRQFPELTFPQRADGGRSPETDATGQAEELQRLRNQSRDPDWLAKRLGELAPSLEGLQRERLTEALAAAGFRTPAAVPPHVEKRLLDILRGHRKQVGVTGSVDATGALSVLPELLGVVLELYEIAFRHWHYFDNPPAVKGSVRRARLDLEASVRWLADRLTGRDNESDRQAFLDVARLVAEMLNASEHGSAEFEKQWWDKFLPSNIEASVSGRMGRDGRCWREYKDRLQREGLDGDNHDLVSRIRAAWFKAVAENLEQQ